MGRRGGLSMSKIVLPTVSWVAVMRLLRKLPRSSPASRPPMGTEMALRAFMGCSAAPQTDSLRYANDLFAEKKVRRSATAALLPGCTSRPHTDSFRVHHVVNQEALQLMLSFHDNEQYILEDADFAYEDFFKDDDQQLCRSYSIIRDGDRLLHDVYADDSVCTSSSMGTCSSRLSAATSRSLMASSAYSTALSRNSVDSEGLYSTATSTSFGKCTLSYTPDLLNVGSHNIRCDSTSSSSISSSCRASELICSRDSNVDQNSFRLGSAGEDAADGEEQQPGTLDVEEENSNNMRSDWNQASQELGKRELQAPSTTYADQDEFLDAMAWSRAGKGSNTDDAPGQLCQECYEGDAEDEEDEFREEMVAEMRYSEDPLEDFAEAISLMVVRQQLNEAAQLQELYCGFLRLNAPSLHATITLAFMRALQRLASFEPHLLHTIL